MQEGPVHDVQWTPAGDYFVAVAGFMPAKTTLFSATCKPIFELGSGPHNLARWSPQVRTPPFPLGFLVYLIPAQVVNPACTPERRVMLCHL